MCFILRLAPCFVATACAVLLSALACTKNDSPFSFMEACAKINSADSAPNAYRSDSPLDRATIPCPRHSLVRKMINVTQSTRCAFPRHWFTSPASIRVIPCRVSRSCSSHSVSMQVLSSGDSVHVLLSNILMLSWHMSNLQVSEMQICMTNILSQNSDPVVYCSFPTTALNSEC